MHKNYFNILFKLVAMRQLNYLNNKQSKCEIIEKT